MDFRQELEGFLGKTVTITKVDGDVQEHLKVLAFGLPHVNVIVESKDGIKKFIRGSELSEIILEE